MFRDTILEIFDQTWPMILICMTIIISLRIAYLIKNKENLILYKELMLLLFAIYIMCLFYVVTFQDVSWSTSNFIPFKEILRYEFGSRLFILNVVGNMLMFLPYGFFVGYLLKNKKVIVAVILGIITSVTIETTQLQIGRVFDIDDIILNVFGVVIGFLIYRFLEGIRGKLPGILKHPLFYNFIVIVMLGLMGLYLFNLIKVGG